jgi:hypothetical protein
VGSLQTANHPWDKHTRTKRQLFHFLLFSSSSSSSKLYCYYCYGQGFTAGVEAAGGFLSSPEGRAMMVEGANAMMAEQSPERRAMMEEGAIAMMAGGRSLLANNGK